MLCDYDQFEQVTGRVRNDFVSADGRLLLQMLCRDLPRLYAHYFDKTWLACYAQVSFLDVADMHRPGGARGGSGRYIKEQLAITSDQQAIFVYRFHLKYL